MMFLLPILYTCMYYIFEKYNKWLFKFLFESFNNKINKIIICHDQLLLLYMNHLNGEVIMFYVFLSRYTYIKKKMYGS